MRLLITGASGFIGRNLVSAVPADASVTATFWRSEDFPTFLAARELSHVTPIRLDLAQTNSETIASRLGHEFDAAIFLAANGDPARSVLEPRFDLAANAQSLVALLEGVKIGRLVFISSGAVYDGCQGAVNPGRRVDPRLPYAISKWTAERYVHSFADQGILGSAACVRFFGAYGPHEPERKIYTRLVQAFAVERRREFTIRGDGRNMIDAMYVDDAVRALLALISPASSSERVETLDLAAGSPLSISELVSVAATAFGVDPLIEYDGEVPEYNEFRSTDASMRDQYGFQPRVSLPDGLRRLAAHRAEAADAGRAQS